MPFVMKTLKKIILIIILFISIPFLLFFRDSTEKSHQVKVAICQIFSLDSDRSGNFIRIENAVAESKENGADIACFPETCILGWVNPAAHERAFPIPGKDSDFLCMLARKYGIYLCIGLAEKEGDKLYDSVILIDDTGNILLKHRKINILTELMTPAYTPGIGVNVVKTKFGKIGLLICADTFKDEILNQMAALEPDLLLVPYGWAASETAWPGHGKSLTTTVQKTAQKCNVPVIGTDLVGEITNGPWTGMVYGGQSIAADKNGTVLTVLKDRDRDIKIISVPIDE